MTNLNFHRIALLIRHQIFSDLRKYRNQLLGLFIGIFATMFFILFNGRAFEPAEMGKAWNHGAAISVLIAGGIFSLISASLTFNPMNSKTKRICALMLPATNLEKFVSYLTVSVVFYHLAFLIALPLADLAQFVFFWVIAKPGGFITPEFLNLLQSESPFTPALVFFGCIALIATYVLGSAFFRRQPFILTTALVWAVNFVLFILFINFLEMFGDNFAEYFMDPASARIFTLDTIQVWLKVALLAAYMLWTALCLSISYRMFCRANVITNKNFGF